MLIRTGDYLTVQLNWLRAFVTIYRVGSFTKAAQKLGISQPAVTHQIRNLEKHLGRALFERLPNGAQPTAAADRLLRRLRADELDLVLSTVRPRERDIAATPFADEEFVLAASPELAEKIGPAVLAHRVRGRAGQGADDRRAGSARREAQLSDELRLLCRAGCGPERESSGVDQFLDRQLGEIRCTGMPRTTLGELVLQQERHHLGETAASSLLVNDGTCFPAIRYEPSLSTKSHSLPPRKPLPDGRLRGYRSQFCGRCLPRFRGWSARKEPCRSRPISSIELCAGQNRS
ncbi:LysR family transcriptional regulator [Nocardia terrae]|uniref:LysR family transcriptional regulator n=1 Tax=Nocardia terrae TaxID=2675851 RepID=UPI0018E05457|nr:LysR family transcriptional regulator [Nocardia terrae]